MSIKNLLSVLFCIICVQGFSNPDTSGIPQKWKNESVIIINYNYSYSYTYGSDYYTTDKKEEKIRVSYYVRDKWGVEELSQLSLPTNIEGSSDENNIGTVYKRNGTKQVITKDQLIPRKQKIDFNASKKTRNFSLESETSQKLAVPSLEVGDILEITYTSSKAYAPTFITLVNKFPMLHFKSDVIIKNSLSGSGSIKTLLMNTTEKLDQSDDQHVNISLDSVDKYKEEILNDNSRQIPYILLKYTNSSPYYTNQLDFSTYRFDINNEKSKNELQTFLVQKVFHEMEVDEKILAKVIINSLQKKYPKITDTATYIKDAFYLYRELIAREKLYSGLNDYEFKNDLYFTNVVSRVLFKKGIAHKVFIAQSGHYSNKPTNYDEFIDPCMGIYIPSKNTYLFNPLYTYDPGNIPAYFEGQYFIQFTANEYFKRNPFFKPGWLFIVLALGGPISFVPATVVNIPFYAIRQSKCKKYRKYDLSEGHFNSTDHENNQIVYDVNVKEINTTDNLVSFERTTSYFGKHKLTETTRICSVSDDYLKADNPYKKMISASIVPSRIGMNEKTKKRLNNIVEADLYDDGFDVKKLKDFKVVETNFFDKTKPFVHTSNFTAKDLAWAFNNYIILNAGNFIGEQLVVPEKSKDRQQDFYIPYQKQFVVNVTIPIPEGYTVENLSEFNVKKETPAGSFTADAKIENNKVIIKTKKAYKFSYYMREDASDVYDFLYEAEKYYNKKMILKK